MAKNKTDDGVKILAGSIPMQGPGGRKYKIRSATLHDFTSEPILEGRIVQKGSVNIDGDDRLFVDIDSPEGISKVYESKALEELFKLGAVGDVCKLVYRGEKDLGGGRSFKRFSVEVWTV